MAKADSQTKAFNPGCYQGIEIKNNSNVTFNPGVYVIKDAKFMVDSNSKITGNGVGFYLSGSSAIVEFNSNTIISLQAPTTGTMKGIILWQTSTTQSKFDSNSAAKLQGALYFPNALFKSDSNSVTEAMGSASTCMMLVASKIEFNSNARINQDSDFKDCPWMPVEVGSDHSMLVAEAE